MVAIALTVLIMQQLPELIDHLQNGQVSLFVYRYVDPIRNVYRIRAGVAYLEFNESELDELLEILREYDLVKWAKRKKKRDKK